MNTVRRLRRHRACAKKLILFPRQRGRRHVLSTGILRCPEASEASETWASPAKRRHSRLQSAVGGECIYTCLAPLPLTGAKRGSKARRPPAGREAYYTVWHEVVPSPGEQYTFSDSHSPEYANTWFQAGDEGAFGGVVSEFSTTSRDEKDGRNAFTDPAIRRVTAIR